VRTFGYYRPVYGPKSTDNYLYNGLIKHRIETSYLAAMFYVQRRRSCQWRSSLTVW